MAYWDGGKPKRWPRSVKGGSPDYTDAELRSRGFVVPQAGQSRRQGPLFVPGPPGQVPVDLELPPLVRDEPPAITDEKLQTLIDPQHVMPNDRVSSDLAESQLGLADRCVVCGKPVTGSSTRRDDRGRPRHRRCP